MMRAEPVSRAMLRACRPRLAARAGSGWVVRVMATASSEVRCPRSRARVLLVAAIVSSRMVTATIAVHFWTHSGQTFASRLLWPIYRLVSGLDWVETKM